MQVQLKKGVMDMLVLAIINTKSIAMDMKLLALFQSILKFQKELYIHY